MSVLLTVQLPDQPTTGDLEYIPLGGDGFTAPKFAYMLRNASVVGDAGGGTIRIDLLMDPRFSSLISYVTGEVQQASTADIEFLFKVAGDRVPAQIFQGDALSNALSSSEIGITWRPAPVILPGGTMASPPEVSWRVANVLADVLRLTALIFCFDIRVRELLPMGPLLFARGDT